MSSILFCYSYLEDTLEKNIYSEQIHVASAHVLFQLTSCPSEWLGLIIFEWVKLLIS